MSLHGQNAIGLIFVQFWPPAQKNSHKPDQSWPHNGKFKVFLRNGAEKASLRTLAQLLIS
jgi:hypothetical protein